MKVHNPITESRREQVSGEVGDILMCLLNFCDQMNIDPLKAIDDKLKAAEKKIAKKFLKEEVEKYEDLLPVATNIPWRDFSPLGLLKFRYYLD